MSSNPDTPKTDDKDQDIAHPVASPVAEPSPPMDGPTPIPEGNKEVEKFLVATDTEGGD